MGIERMRYRLAIDLGSTSIGWAMVRLDAENNPCAIIKAGVRIFSDGRNPKDGSSLAVSRREARAMRRRRDRLLKRKARMVRLLIQHGFFSKPANSAVRCFTSTSGAASRATARPTRKRTTAVRSSRPSGNCAKP